MSEDTKGPTEPLVGLSTLWKDLTVLLPDTEEELKLELSEKVDRSLTMLLQQAVGLFYVGHWQECLQTSEAILDYSWEKLNTGPWQDVDKEWRRVYSFGCLLKALCLCRAPQATAVAEALRVCDMGLLMGAAILGDILLKVVTVLQTHLLPRKQPACGPHQDEPVTKVCIVYVLLLRYVLSVIVHAEPFSRPTHLLEESSPLPGYSLSQAASLLKRVLC